MSERPAGNGQALRLLTLAALALPGIDGAARAQEEPSVSVTYGHYADGERDLNGHSYESLNLKPIRVDSLAVDAAGAVTDRLRLAAHYAQDTWSGATPVVSLPNAAVETQLISGASVPTALFTDSRHHPVIVDFNSYNPQTGTYATTRDDRLVHVMASASPETRREGSLTASYAWDDAELDLGQGVSEERDFHSLFVNVGGKLFLDQKRTVLSGRASYTWSRIDASLAANTAADWGAYADQIRDRHGEPTLYGRRREFAAELGVSRVVNRGALVEAGVTVSRTSGLLENPYKAVMFAFDDPDQTVDASGLRYLPLKGVLEQRPDLRTQVGATVRYVQHIDGLDAALHLEYQFHHDSWGIDAHTLSASLDQPLGDGWSITPGMRYYTQSKAFFYAPYFVFQEPYPAHPGGPLDFSQIPIRYYSSDTRLSGFGVLSESIGVTKRFDNGLRLDLAYQHYAHRGSLKLGGGGENRFADYTSSMLAVSLSIDLNQSRAARLDGIEDAEAAAADLAFPPPLPAGLTFARMAGPKGSFGFDVAYLGSRAGHGLRLHGVPAGDDAVAAACGDTPCTLAPVSAGQARTLLEFRFAATDRLTLEFAPQIVDDRLELRSLDVFSPGPGGFIGPGPSGPDGSGRHQSGGLGDTTIAGLFRLVDTPDQHAHVALGLSIPTGSAHVRLNGAADQASYALQRSSGTWDARLSLTYTAVQGRVFEGIQISGVKRLEHANGAGYRLGDEAGATLWAGYAPTAWLTVTGRIEYQWRGRIEGAFKPHLQRNVPELEARQADYDVNGDGVVDANDVEYVTVYRDEPQPHAIAGPEDLPENYGGQTWMAGVGIALRVPAGALRGDTLSIEWLEPVGSSLNGYQLRPGRTLALRLGVDL